MSKLDETALLIEITLISLVESLALASLAGNAAPILHDFSHAVFLPYVIAALLFTLIFWAQAILHAVSFIRWPIRVGHMFLYFVAGFVQVISFGNMTDPVRWFFWSGMFTLVIGALYLLDLDLIHQMVPTFEKLPGGPGFMAEVERRHRYELHTLVPVALIFNGVAFFVLLLYPTHLGLASYAVFGVLQVAVSIAALIDCMSNFRIRAELIAQLWKED